jgi:hypothetical protein
MVDMSELKRVFADKLLRTGSFDEALTKVAWGSFKAGVEAGKEEVSGNEWSPDGDYMVYVKVAKEAIDQCKSATGQHRKIDTFVSALAIVEKVVKE